jgi:hypothetical protein
MLHLRAQSQTSTAPPQPHREWDQRDGEGGQCQAAPFTQEELPHLPIKTTGTRTGFVLPPSPWSEAEKGTRSLAFSTSHHACPKLFSPPSLLQHQRSQQLMMSDIQSPRCPQLFLSRLQNSGHGCSSRGEVGAHYNWPPLPHLQHSREPPLPNIPQQKWA